jgi:hypothetical protein
MKSVFDRDRPPSQKYLTNDANSVHFEGRRRRHRFGALAVDSHQNNTMASRDICPQEVLRWSFEPLREAHAFESRYDYSEIQPGDEATLLEY